jgi:hypothetical protein
LDSELQVEKRKVLTSTQDQSRASREQADLHSKLERTQTVRFDVVYPARLNSFSISRQNIEEVKKRLARVKQENTELEKELKCRRFDILRFALFLTFSI